MCHGAPERTIAIDAFKKKLSEKNDFKYLFKG